MSSKIMVSHVVFALGAPNFPQQAPADVVEMDMMQVEELHSDLTSALPILFLMNLMIQ
jgi:hypothetical protein